MDNIFRELHDSLTTDQVMAYLNISPRTMYRLIRNGELPAMRVGRHWRFRRSDLDAWLARQGRSNESRSESRIA